uniref:Uncharacterized protein n=1 Tax=Panagrolaimus sp. ES5 TaxID=591445 RepID=A0AC34GSR3_9BILA
MAVNLEADPIKNGFEEAAAVSSQAVLQFMNSGNEQYDFCLDYFSNILQAKVGAKFLNVTSVDGREYQFNEALPQDVQEAVAQHSPRVIIKGCHAKFNAFITSLHNVDYLFCQFRTKYIRHRLGYKFNVEDAILDVHGITFEALSELKAKCSILRLYKAEDCITKLHSLPPNLVFPAIEEVHIFSDFAKTKSLDRQLEYMSSAIAVIPKLFPMSVFISLVFNLGEFPNTENFNNFVNDVTALMNDAPDKDFVVGCVFCHVNREPPSNFNRDGWSFYYYNLQGKKEIKISSKKALHLIIDPRRGPAKYSRTLALDREEPNGELENKWYDEVQFI